MKKLLSVLTTFLLVTNMLLLSSLTIVASEMDEGWVLVDTYTFPIPETFKAGDPWSYFASIEETTFELQTTIPYDIGLYSSKDYSNPVDLHAKYTISSPPNIIRAKETINIKLSQMVISGNYGKYSIGFLPFCSLDIAELSLGSATGSKVNATATYSDGTKASKIGIGNGKDAKSQQSFDANFSLQFRDRGSIGQKCALYTGVYGGSPGSIGIRYTYEWKQLSETSSSTPSSNSVDLGKYSWEGEWSSNWGTVILTQNGANISGTYTHDKGKIIATVSGNTLSGTWSESPSYTAPNDAGELILTMSDDGLSFTGKWRYGTSGSWGTWEGGKRTAALSINTYDNYIILRINNSMMNVNGVEREIDPGRGTSPILKDGRTMLPIRAVVEAMGGTIGWDATDSKITVNVEATTLELWLNKKIIKVNGIEKQIDVAPTSINGRTMVPVRFIIDNIPESDLSWNSSTSTATISY